MLPSRPAISLIPNPVFVVALCVTGVFLLAGVGLPLTMLFARAVTQPEGFAAFFEPDVLAVVRFTAMQAAVSTAISAAFGISLGLWSGARHGVGARRDIAWFAVPFSVPTVVAATAWVWWLGRSGPLGLFEWSYSLKAVVLAHVFFNVPWVALWVSRARMRVPDAQLAAAATLGAGPLARLRAVVWPEIKWPFAAALTQVFGFCVMSFALVLILGGGPPVETLETAIYARLRMGVLDLSGAMACGVWELILGLSPWILVQVLRGRVEPRREADKVSFFEHFGFRGDLCDQKCSFFERLARRLGRWPLFGVLFVVPYFVLWMEPKVWSAALKPSIAVQVGLAFWISFKLAALVTLGTLAAAGAGVIAVSRLGRSRILASAVSIALVIPAGLSVLVLGLGFWLAYEEWIDPFDGSLGAMAALQIAVFTPVVYRVLWGLAASLKRDEIEAALTLGAAPLRAFREVEWPRWRAPVIAAAAMVAATSLGEVAAVSLFYSEELVPLPLLIARWMGQYRFDEARLVAGLLLLLSMSVTLLMRDRSGGHV